MSSTRRTAWYLAVGAMGVALLGVAAPVAAARSRPRRARTS